MGNAYRHPHFYFIFLLLIFLSSGLAAQQPKMQIDPIVSKNKLSQSTISVILQDEQGYMWFVTGEDLCRYDGYNFKFYQHDSLDPHSLPNDHIRDIYVDSQGILWVITTSKGLSRFNRALDRFEHYLHSPENIHSLSSNEIDWHFEDGTSTLWFNSPKSGINRYDRGNDRFIRYHHSPEDPGSLSSNDIQLILEDRSGSLWFANKADGINKFIPEKNLFIRYQHDPNDIESLGNNNITHMIEDDAGRIWIATRNGISILNKERQRFWRLQNNPKDPNTLCYNEVNCIFQDSSGEFWIGTEGGLNRLILPVITNSTSAFEALFEPQKLKFHHYQYQPGQSHSFRNNSIFPIFEDKFGAVWVGTGWQNLYKFDRSKNMFTNIFPEMPGVLNPGNIASLVNHKDPRSRNWLEKALNLHEISTVYEDRSEVLWVGSIGNGLNQYKPRQQKFPGTFVNIPVCQTICEDRAGNLWIGSREGLYKFEKGSGRLTAFPADIYAYDYPSDIKRKQDIYITFLYEDSASRLWLGTETNLYVMDKSLDTPVKVRQLFNTQHTKLIYEDSKGTIWIGTKKGLKEYDPISGIFLHHEYTPEDPNSISHSDINAIFEDQQGNIWIGTASGLSYINKNNRNVSRFLTDLEFINEIRNNNIIAISGVLSDSLNVAAQEKKQLWLATLDGLIKFDPNTNTIVSYTEDDGLANNNIVSMLQDHRGKLWLGTANGLSRFNPANNTFKNFNLKDGLFDNEFYFAAIHQSRNGQIYLGSNSGLTFFHPDSIRFNPLIPEVIVTAFKIFDEEVLLDSAVSQKKHFTISQNNKVFSFEFSVTDFANVRSNEFAYMLEGIHEDWIYNGNKNTVSFTGLARGRYLLRVKGANSNGIWNEVGSSLRITIVPPWWKTDWAYAAYLLIAIGLVGSIWHFQVKRIRIEEQLRFEHMEAEKLKEVARLKSRFFANISHEFRTPLTLMIGPVKQMLNGEFQGDRQSQYQMILRNGQRLQRLINQLLDLSRLEDGRMILNVSRGDLVEFLKRIIAAFESLAVRKEIALTFKTPSELLHLYFDPDKLEKVIINLLSNAFKFTGAGGRIDIQLSVNNEQLSINNDRARDKKLTTDHCLLITVKDTGSGIPSESLPHIFDRFYQVDDSQTREQEGSGIGLALTKELVELHYGEISVNSEVNKGSEFIIRLPLGKAHLKSEEINEVISDSPRGQVRSRVSEDEEMLELLQKTSHHSNPVTSSVHSIKPPSEIRPASRRNPICLQRESEIVLVVEDNPDMRQYIQQCLQEDYRIIKAVNGKSGFQKASAITPDLIISDVMMPEMDGLALCEMLKTDQRTSHIPVILLTARAERDDKLEGLATGANDYLTKPFDAQELRLKIKNLLISRKQLWEKFKNETAPELADMQLTSLDRKFLERAIAIIEKHLDDAEFETKTFAEEISLSRSQLNRKLRALTGQSTRDFIRTLRLKRAAQLLRSHTGNVSEIAYQVGFNHLSHFAKIFKEMYGQAPSIYAAQYSEKEH